MNKNIQYKIRSLQSKVDYAIRKVKENQTALEAFDDLIERELIRGIRENKFRLSLARLVVRIHEEADHDYYTEEYKLPKPSKEALRLSEQAVKMMQEIDILRDDIYEWNEEIQQLKGKERFE